MSNHDNKNTNDNHHANPSAISPELEALRSTDHAHKDASKLHDLKDQDKRAAAREIHTNGSTPRGDQ